MDQGLELTDLGQVVRLSLSQVSTVGWLYGSPLEKRCRNELNQTLWSRFMLIMVSFLACSLFPPFVWYFSSHQSLFSLKWKVEVCENLTFMVIWAHPCTVGERFYLQVICCPGLWCVLNQEWESGQLSEYWCEITVGRENHLFGPQTESVQWPIHFNVNCAHLSRVGQHLENKGKRLWQSPFHGWLLRCTWFYGLKTKVQGSCHISSLYDRSLTSLWFTGQHT